MNENEKVEFYIEVSTVDTTEEDLDRMTRQLLSELRELDVDSAELTKGGSAPNGTKSGDVITTGSIAIAVLPSVLPKLVETIQAWVLRSNNRTVKFKGKGIEFEGSPEDLHKLLASLEKGRYKK